MKFTKLDVYYVALEASSQHMNGDYFYPSSACVCVCVSFSPGRLWQTLPCVQTESAAVTWCLLLSNLTSGTAYCCVEAAWGRVLFYN